jgi:ribosomal protein L7Ae-like RNA K-turn-binding protein
MIDVKGILGIVGLCRGAGRTVVGVPMICEAMKKNSTKKASSDEEQMIVVVAEDCSANTHKRISDKCAYYKVRLVCINCSCEELAHAVGKNGAVAAVAVNDKGFCRALLKKLS